MEDETLKKLLKEEKRRREKERDKERGRERGSSKHRREKERSKERRSKHRSKERNVEIKYMFIYEDDEGKLYTDLSKIEKTEVKIFPVYISGGDSNLTEEIITKKESEWTSEVENSWLNIINDSSIKKVPFDLEDVTVYNNQMFHCVDDLHDYLDLYGPDVLPVNK